MKTSLMAHAFSVEASPSTKLLLALAFYADESGKCPASGSALEGATGQCPRTIRKGIKDLRSRGLVTVTKASGRQGNHNIYQLHQDGSE